MTDEIREEGIKAAVRTFRQFEFSLLQAGNGEEKKLLYNLYIPENLEKGKKYPLVLFIHDMGSCSADVKNTLIQGKGATVWAADAWQKRQPCFVLAPCYERQCANDDFQVTWEADATIGLVKELLLQYAAIDEKRIYGTGQSMGCMMLCELMLRNPWIFRRLFSGSRAMESKNYGLCEKRKHLDSGVGKRF